MEKVLVVPTSTIDCYLGKEAYVNSNIERILDIIEKNHSYIDREYAEYACEYKQIIPYAILTNGERIFLTQRLKGQTEKRLHGRCSIGLGGHVNPSEESSGNLIFEGMRRELNEEVGLKFLPEATCVGIINDHSTEVSNFHIGLVYYIHTNEKIEVRETDKMLGKWVTDEEIENKYEMLESWSQIAWDAHNKWKNDSRDKRLACE